MLWVALLLFVVVVEVVAVPSPRYSECRRAKAAVGRVVPSCFERKVESERVEVESLRVVVLKIFFPPTRPSKFSVLAK